MSNVVTQKCGAASPEFSRVRAHRPLWLWPDNPAAITHHISAIEAQALHGTVMDSRYGVGECVKRGDDISPIAVPFDDIGSVFATFAVASA